MATQEPQYSAAKPQITELPQIQHLCFLILYFYVVHGN